MQNILGQLNERQRVNVENAIRNWASLHKFHMQKAPVTDADVKALAMEIGAALVEANAGRETWCGTPSLDSARRSLTGEIKSNDNPLANIPPG